MQVERRPLVCIDAETGDGQRHSVILQNAETVKLVGPTAQPSTGSTSTSSSAVTSHTSRTHSSSGRGTEALSDAPAGSAAPPDTRAWRAIAVSEVAQGDSVLVHLSEAGRHLGHAVKETLTER